jgi:hypothetical protein
MQQHQCPCQAISGFQFPESQWPFCGKARFAADPLFAILENSVSGFMPSGTMARWKPETKTAPDSQRNEAALQQRVAPQISRHVKEQ